MATTPPVYSTLFSCLYDEPEPYGNLGRGTHYSVFRSVEWLDVVRAPLALPQVHDFSVIWDEDHDERCVDLIEQIYLQGLLSPVQFIGERKGVLTVIVAAKFYFAHSEEYIADYLRKLNEISSDPNHGDSWPTELGFFDRQPGSPHQTDLRGLIAAEPHRVQTYVRNIDSLWSLGTKPFVPRVYRDYPHAPPTPPMFAPTGA